MRSLFLVSTLCDFSLERSCLAVGADAVEEAFPGLVGQRQWRHSLIGEKAQSEQVAVANHCCCGDQNRFRSHGMIQWKNFVHDGQQYDLMHLHPFVRTFEQPAKGDKPARTYEVQVIFSLHCFTRGANDGDALQGHLAYADTRETRIFDFARYEQSQSLRDIIDGLPTAPCFHTDHGNFFTIKRVNPATGDAETYEVYFTASRSGAGGGRLNLFVQSDYVRDARHATNKPSRKKIGFFVILHNILNGRPIKAPQ